MDRTMSIDSHVKKEADEEKQNGGRLQVSGFFEFKSHTVLATQSVFRSP